MAGGTCRQSHWQTHRFVAGMEPHEKNFITIQRQLPLVTPGIYRLEVNLSVNIYVWMYVLETGICVWSNFKVMSAMVEKSLVISL